MICFDNFLKWAETRFTNVIIKGNEIKLNSIFAEDSKNHLYCNPYGGKKKRKDGCYHCWKTGKKGTLVGLVMLVDSCSYQEAKDLLSGETPFHLLETKLEEIFTEKSEKKDEKDLKLPEDTFLIENLPDYSLYKMEAISYLEQRKISFLGLYYCFSNNYKNLYRNRIVIPYYDKSGDLIYFNARHIGNNPTKYLGPSKNTGIGKSDVLYFPSWPSSGSKVYLTEGEFDALSLNMCGYNAAACGGKFIDDKQVELLRDYPVCLSFDADSAGFSGIIEVGNKLIKSGIKVTFVRPPKGYKDWNKLLVTYDESVVRDYINKYEKSFNEWTTNLLLINKL